MEVFLATFKIVGIVSNLVLETAIKAVATRVWKTEHIQNIIRFGKNLWKNCHLYVLATLLKPVKPIQKKDQINEHKNIQSIEVKSAKESTRYLSEESFLADLPRSDPSEVCAKQFQIDSKESGENIMRWIEGARQYHHNSVSSNCISHRSSDPCIFPNNRLQRIKSYQENACMQQFLQPASPVKTPGRWNGSEGDFGEVFELRVWIRSNDIQFCTPPKSYPDVEEIRSGIQELSLEDDYFKMSPSSWRQFPTIESPLSEHLKLSSIQKITLSNQDSDVDEIREGVEMLTIEDKCDQIYPSAWPRTLDSANQNGQTHRNVFRDTLGGYVRHDVQSSTVRYDQFHRISFA